MEFNNPKNQWYLHVPYIYKMDLGIGIKNYSKAKDASQI